MSIENAGTTSLIERNWQNKKYLITSLYAVASLAALQLSVALSNRTPGLAIATVISGIYAITKTLKNA